MDLERILVTGGAGFIGSNVCDYFLSRGSQVTVLDDFSRRGSQANLEWLQHRHGSRVCVVRCDVSRDTAALVDAVRGMQVVFHFAGQVAVTTSVTNPRRDFEVNALGTLNVLEAVRAVGDDPIVVYSSTNKVYGGMEQIAVEERGGRYQYRDHLHGISEDVLLDFHSPYGCSKGCADQYVRDYARIYGLRTVVFRQSCIYGYRQFGVEDQGWLAWFTIAALFGRPITIYGDGKQVRDVLFVDDLVSAYHLAVEHINVTKGRVYNIGGGPQNQLSLIELISMLEELYACRLSVSYAGWRPGDQPVFVSDVRKAKRDFDWEPTISVRDGVQKLAGWVLENRALFRGLFPT